MTSLPRAARYLPFTRRFATYGGTNDGDAGNPERRNRRDQQLRRGEKLGSIHSVMIDKISGKVAYAVMSFGGFLGIGDRYHPLPWHVLTYDTGQGGYVVDLDRNKLEGAPTYGTSETPNWSDRRWGQQVHDYYGTRPYWE